MLRKILATGLLGLVGTVKIFCCLLHYGAKYNFSQYWVSLHNKSLYSKVNNTCDEYRADPLND